MRYFELVGQYRFRNSYTVGSYRIINLQLVGQYQIKNSQLVGQYQMRNLQLVGQYKMINLVRAWLRPCWCCCCCCRRSRRHLPLSLLPLRFHCCCCYCCWTVKIRNKFCRLSFFGKLWNGYMLNDLVIAVCIKHDACPRKEFKNKKVVYILMVLAVDYSKK